MFGWATGSFTILRGVEETETDDDQVVGEIVAQHTHLGLRPAGDQYSDHNSLSPRAITQYAGRASSSVDLRGGDRVINEITDEIFSVSQVRVTPSMIGRRGLKFDASKLH